MWYFTWILGAMLASLFAVVNVMWLEVNESMAAEEINSDSNKVEHQQ